MSLTLPEKIIALHHALEAADLPYAFGGALALAWCTQRARGTIDIDVNVFVPPVKAEQLFDALPEPIRHSKKDLAAIKREGQVRLWWDKTPIDLFLNTIDLHDEMATRCRFETFVGESVPFLSCLDLAILKAFFNRTKDWADLEEMQRARTLNVTQVLAVVVEHLGPDDERVGKLTSLEALQE